MDRLPCSLFRPMSRIVPMSHIVAGCVRRAVVVGPLVLAAGLILGLMPVADLRAEEAQWIWSPAHRQEQVPNVACHFRRTFSLQTPIEGQVTISADDAFELHVNGRKVGQGEYEKDLKQFDISRYLVPGKNTVAVKVSNLRGGTAAFAARVMVRQRSGWSSYSTDRSWKSELRPQPLWNTSLYKDQSWQTVQVFGPLGSTAPWDRRQEVAAGDQNRSERFQVNEEFSVYRVLDGTATGSLIAMTFNEFGHVVASREGGPLLLIYDSDGDQKLDQTRVYCDTVKNCQGILALNGEVFVTAEGPSGHGLYRLIDTDHNGTLDEVRLLLKMRGEVGEHSAHGLTLGPDGLIYIVLGNHVQPELAYDPASPHRNYYEGDLLTPRYEDPGGHAQGIKVPGGAIIRTDVEGRSVELVAGGLRNAYDLAFNAQGDLFVHDSDMESDIGGTWYRPTQVFHVVPGGEYGWRSGWAKWPAHFVDGLPGLVDTGRGSPTGAVAYNHHMFPVRYHDALFLADWSLGRILVVRAKRDGGSFTGDSEVFLQGQPLNVTDLDVGPDGSLYFCTGGRGTAGGIYRVTWKGQVPESVTDLGKGISRVIRQPQLSSAWARQNVAAVKQQLGDRWDSQLVGVAKSTSNTAAYRTRALDLMQLFGSPPTTEFLITLAQAKNEAVRGKAAELLGLHDGPQASETLIGLLEDGDRAVRRKACEALARLGQTAPYESLAPLLGSDDRYESWAARRLLERTSPRHWRDLVLADDNPRVVIQGSLALMITQPNNDNALAVIERIQEMMLGFVSDRDFIDLLRVTQVTLHRSQIDIASVSGLREQLSEEFPAGHPIINRELARLLVYLQADAVLGRMLAYLDSDADEVDKLHLAMHLCFQKSGWTPEQRMTLLQYLEKANGLKGGNSMPHYVKQFVRDFVKQMSSEEVLQILAQGEQLPTAALGALYRLPHQLDGETLDLLRQLDGRLTGVPGEAADRLKVGIVAVLARGGDEDSQSYLREIWDNDPERRATVAMGLAQTPDLANWEYLVRSLPVLQGALAVEVLKQLREIDRKPEEPEHYRQVILRGLILGEEGGQSAVDLLEQWTGQSQSGDDDKLPQALTAWQKWFAATYPDQPAAELPKQSETSKWQFTELLDYLEGEQGAEGSIARGAEVFAKVQCAKCHRFGDIGDVVGPDLTGISRRFTRREILESILFPSHVISNQFASKTVITVDGRSLSGMLAADGNGQRVILQADGAKVTIAEDEIDEIQPNRTSSMPEGLLNNLDLQAISDLFAYLGVQPQRNVARQPDTQTVK